MTDSSKNPTPGSASPAVQPIELPVLDAVPARDARAAMPDLAATTAAAANPLHGIRTRLSVVLGGIELTVGELLGAKEQQVLRLDRSIEQPVDVMLEGQVVARGMLVAVGENFGVRITELPRALTP